MVTQKTGKQQKFQFDVLIYGLILGIFIGAYLFSIFIPVEEKVEEKIIYKEKDNAMLLVQFNSWAGNINDSSEVIFDYWIYNFGIIEAKDVKVRCEVTDSNDNIIKKEIFNKGNIASSSYEYQESIMKYSDPYSGKFFGACYFESATGDHINLYDRLTDLQ